MRMRPAGLGARRRWASLRFAWAAVLVAGASLSAEDWPQWRGPGRNGVSSEAVDLSLWTEKGPPLEWRIDVGEGYSSCAVVGDRLWTMEQQGEEECVLCVAASTGRRLWRRAYKARLETEEGNGPRAAPCYDQGRVYTLGGTGILTCLDAESGAIRFQIDLPSAFGGSRMPWGASHSPLVDEENLYVLPGGTSGKTVAALDKTTGKTRWTAGEGKSAYSSPVLADFAGRRVVLFFPASGLLGLSPTDGSKLFEFPWTTRFSCNIATPIVDGSRIYISSGYDTGCALVEIAPVGQGLSRREVYRNKEMKNHFSSCVLVDGHLYGFTDFFLCCQEFSTGQTRWRQRGFGKGSLIACGGILLVLGDQGKLAAVRPNPQEFQELRSVIAMREKCWTEPAVARGRLFLRNQKEVRCLRFSGAGGAKGRSLEP